MTTIMRWMAAMILTLLLPAAATAADDPFLGSWSLNLAKSRIAKDPGVKSKDYVFAPSAEGVLITETVEALAEPGKKHVSRLPFTYGKPTAQTGPGFDTLLVVRADPRTVYWTVLGKGQVLSQLQVTLSADGRQMTFRYLWSASDPTGSRLNDRYLYERR